MEHKGSHLLPADRPTVFAALRDPAVVAACAPGLESIERTGPGEMKAVASVGIGPLRTKLTATLKSESSDPPNGFVVTWDGRGRPAGSATGRVAVTLTHDAGGTMVAWRADTTPGGSLAELTGRQVSPVVRRLADEFFSRLAAQLAGVPVGEAVTAAAAVSDDPPPAGLPEPALAAPEPPPPAPMSVRWVDELDHSPAAVQLGDEPSEPVVTDKSSVAGRVAEEAERRLEIAAATGVLGGPAIWGWAVLMVMVVVLGLVVMN